MTPAPVVGVLAIQGDVREHARSLELAGAHSKAVRGEQDLQAIDALVIPGGESTTMSIIAQRDGLLEPLRDFRASGKPCFGSCAGLIFLADRVLDGRADQQTIGGLDITVRRNAFGRQVDSFESDLDIAAIGAPEFRAVFIRAPWVEQVGDEVEVLATLPDSDRIVAVRQGSLLATAFHPELTADPRIHRYFVHMIGTETTA